LVIDTALGPLTGLAGLILVYAAGGGLIELRSDGFWFPVSVLSLLVVGDVIVYFWHVALHKVPALWALHSFHHSEENLNATAGPRIFWLEVVVANVLVFPAVGILLKAPPSVALASAGIAMALNLFIHLNAPVHFGPFWMLLVSPQLHRIHHSNRAEHLDHNFANLFPFIDVIFGTAWKPKPGEYPPTGLMDGETPSDLAVALAWPLRERWSRTFRDNRRQHRPFLSPARPPGASGRQGP
jgi:sterol desaturase/sphingolipid hydroxylase (fatty acid hydroxylase superfamily)